MVEPHADVPNCQACGACCFAPNPGHVPVTGADHARLLPAEQRDLVTWRGNRAFMKVTGDRCVNLLEVDGHFSCAIYERRPTVCRDLERGDDACAYERGRVHGERP